MEEEGNSKSIEKKGKKKFSYLYSISMLLLGFAFFISGFFTARNFLNINENYTAETLGYIIDYRTDRDYCMTADGDRELHITKVYTLEYIVDNVVYTIEDYNLEVGKNNIDKGFTIKYNPDNPSQAICQRSKSIAGIFGVVFSGIGLIIMIGSVYFTIVSKRKQKRLEQGIVDEKELKEEAERQRYANMTPFEKSVENIKNVNLKSIVLSIIFMFLFAGLVMGILIWRFIVDISIHGTDDVILMIPGILFMLGMGYVMYLIFSLVIGESIKTYKYHKEYINNPIEFLESYKLIWENEHPEKESVVNNVESKVSLDKSSVENDSNVDIVEQDADFPDLAGFEKKLDSIKNWSIKGEIFLYSFMLFIGFIVFFPLIMLFKDIVNNGFYSKNIIISFLGLSPFVLFYLFLLKGFIKSSIEEYQQHLAYLANPIDFVEAFKEKWVTEHLNKTTDTDKDNKG